MKCNRLLLLSLFLLYIGAGCSFKSGLYSVIITVPGVQHAQNPLNDLPEPYHKKEMLVPSSIQIMGEQLKKELADTLQKYNAQLVDTTIKITNGNVIIKLNSCEKHSLALVVLEHYELEKRGNFLHLRFRYVCGINGPDYAWAATNFYLADASNECYDGFHTLEFQMQYQNGLPSQEAAALSRLLVVGADQ